jgi:hypothetical protein
MLRHYSGLGLLGAVVLVAGLLPGLPSMRAGAVPSQCFGANTTLAAATTGGEIDITVNPDYMFCFPASGTLVVEEQTVTYTSRTATQFQGLSPAMTDHPIGTRIRGITSVFDVDVRTCYGGSAPAGAVACGSGSSSTAVPLDTSVLSYELLILPAGNRLTRKPVTFTPALDASQWQFDPVACGLPDVNNECSAGAVVGDYTGQIDFICDGYLDVVGDASGFGAAVTGWPEGEPADVYWPEVSILRTSQGVIPTTGPNAYVTVLLPWPTSGPLTFSFDFTDTAVLSNIWIAGAAPFAIAPVRLQHVTYERPDGASGYGSAGLRVSTTLFDDPTLNGNVCFNGPQHQILSNTYLHTPATSQLIPRWTMLTSQPDDGDATVSRIVDSDCVNVGSFAGPDTDGDCLPDADEPPGCDTERDCDDDGLNDGVEKWNFSCITGADVDNDTVNDFEEMFNFTRPNGGMDPCTGTAPCASAYPLLDISSAPGIQSSPYADDVDSDCDGQRDPRENGATVVDADDDDNCPAVFNPDQVNTDALPQHHGMGAGTGDNTNPDEDVAGDACDDDDDNDGLLDIEEDAVYIQPWAGGSALVCTNDTVGTTFAGLDPLQGDSDGDMVLDGAECNLASRPDLALRAVATCIGADPDGCAQPNNGAGGGAADPDGDGLFMPFVLTSHAPIEDFYATQNVDLGAGLTLDIDGDGANGAADRDSDRDDPGGVGIAVFLQDGLESLYYGTRNAVRDTDGDGCSDVDEVLDVSGDRKVTSGDQLAWALKKNALPSGRTDFDLDGDIDDYTGVNFDFNKSRTLESADQLMMAAVIATASSCPTARSPNVVLDGTLN